MYMSYLCAFIENRL